MCVNTFSKDKSIVNDNVFKRPIREKCIEKVKLKHFKTHISAVVGEWYGLSCSLSSKLIFI